MADNSYLSEEEKKQLMELLKSASTTGDISTPGERLSNAIRGSLYNAVSKIKDIFD